MISRDILLLLMFFLIVFAGCKKEVEQPSYFFKVEFDNQVYERRYPSIHLNGTSYPPIGDNTAMSLVVHVEYEAILDTPYFNSVLALKKLRWTDWQVSSASFAFPEQNVGCDYSDTLTNASLQVVIAQLIDGTAENPGIVSGSFHGTVKATYFPTTEELRPIKGSFSLPHQVYR